MKIIDFVLILVTLLTTIDVYFLKKRYGSIKLLTSITIVVIIIHAFFSEVRWQVLPLYTYPLYIMIYYSLLQIDSRRFRKMLNRIGRVVVPLIIFSSVLFMILLPIKELEAPIGDYTVGTKTFNIHDNEREEIYGNNVGRYRDIRLQIWYPSDSDNGQTPVKWMIDGQAVTREYAKTFEMFRFMLDHTGNVYSHSYKDLEASDKEFDYPVVILSHGWISSKNFHLDIAERLASNGYIVVGIDHTYGAAATRLDNGEVAVADHSALPERDEEMFLEKASTLLDVYSEDIKLTIDYLDKMYIEDSILKAKIDLRHIGVYGHSTGAGAGVKAAIEDERITAVMGMDPWVEPISVEILEKGLPVSSMFFRSEEWSDHLNNGYLKILFDNSKETKEVLQIDGSKHSDFTMMYAFTDVAKYIGLGGKYSSYEDSLVQQEFVLNFFDSHLKAQEKTLKSNVEKYDHIKLIEIN